MIATSTIGLGMSAGLGLYQTVKGMFDENKATKAIEELEPQELNNAHENRQIDTTRADRLTRANNQISATSIDALQRGGARSVNAGLSKVLNNNIDIQNQIEEELHKEKQQRDIDIANDNVRIRQIQEKRESDTLLGYGQQLMTGQQDVISGLSQVAKGVTSYGFNKEYENAVKDTGNTTKLTYSGRSGNANQVAKTPSYIGGLPKSYTNFLNK